VPLSDADAVDLAPPCGQLVLLLLCSARMGIQRIIEEVQIMLFLVFISVLLELAGEGDNRGRNGSAKRGTGRNRNDDLSWGIEACETLAHGSIGLIGNSYQQVATSFSEAHSKRTLRLSMFGLEQF